MEYTITFDADPSHTDITTLWKGICEHAKLARGLGAGTPFAFFIKDEMGDIKGGCSGYLFHGCLYTDFLWVDNSLRGQHYGIRLMESAEKLAIENGCRFMAVHTMDFEAPEFYKKLGYVIEFERRGFEKNSIMYFLRKNLIS
jgi:GNAT superfamily N-acetyltransferase